MDKRRTSLEKSVNVESNNKDGGLTDDDESEVTESESEWAKEREETRRKELEKIKEQGIAQMKAEEVKRKETERKLQEVSCLFIYLVWFSLFVIVGQFASKTAHTCTYFCIIFLTI